MERKQTQHMLWDDWSIREQGQKLLAATLLLRSLDCSRSMAHSTPHYRVTPFTAAEHLYFLLVAAIFGIRA